MSNVFTYSPPQIYYPSHGASPNIFKKILEQNNMYEKIPNKHILYRA